jgi:hypothetical protein
LNKEEKKGRKEKKRRKKKRKKRKRRKEENEKEKEKRIRKHGRMLKKKIGNCVVCPPTPRGYLVSQIPHMVPSCSLQINAFPSLYSFLINSSVVCQNSLGVILQKPLC